MSVGQPAGTSFIQEVDVFNEETEERNHNLEERDDKFILTFYTWDNSFLYFLEESCVHSYLLLAAVCGLRPLGGATERSAVVAEVTGRVHLVLSEVRQRRQWSNTHMREHRVGNPTFYQKTQESKHIIHKIFNLLVHGTCDSESLMCAGFLTSRISNLSVLTLLQVFFSLATGLMFIPAERQRKHEYTECLQRQTKDISLYFLYCLASA